MEDRDHLKDDKRPLAIFICGPIAAGKSHSIESFREKGYTQGAVIQADVIYRTMLKTFSDQGMNKETAEMFADKGSMAQRDAMVKACIDNKKSFTLENTMSEHVFEKMKAAKEAGFHVVTHVTFQKNVDWHIDSERRRRLNTKEVGAHFANDKQAVEAIKYTYDACLKGIARAAEHTTSMKVYVNYMNREPEFNKPVIAAQLHPDKTEGRLEVSETRGGRGNQDLNKVLDSLSLEMTNKENKVKVINMADWKSTEKKQEVTAAAEPKKKSKGMAM